MEKTWRWRLARAFAFAALLVARAFAADVVVVAHDPGYYTSLARHAQRWLARQRVESELAAPADMDKALASAKIAFLVGFDAPTDAEMKSLSAYRARGGRLVVFYSSSKKLAALMGVRVVGYRQAAYPGQWSRMDFKTRMPEGCPDSILQTSTVLQLAEPIPGKSRTIATWSDRSGKPTGDAAWIASPAGYWMTHVLLADGDEALKAQLLGAFVGSVAPSLWDYKSFQRRNAAEAAAARAFAEKQKPKAGEIHAVWDHTGCGLYPGDWPKTMRLLAKSGVTDLFVNVAGAGFAHYPSAVLPRSKTYAQEGDQLRACLAAAKGTGIRVHAWLLCFNATRAPKEWLTTLRKKGWMLKTREGGDTEYLDPSKAEARSMMLRAIDEIQAKYEVAGVHLDFVRWYERSAKPADAAEHVTRFVADARLHTRRPLWLTAAVLGKYPSCVAAVGQDWDGWLGSNLVDYVVPMDYTEDAAKLEGYLKQHAELKTHARKTIVGIGVTANESRLTARQVMDQLLLSRRYGVAGAALFDLDTTLEKDILPYLRMGLWRK